MEQLKRSNYYEGLMIDVRNVFIGYGRYLERQKINGQGTLDDYEEYLCKSEQELITQKDIEYTDFLSFLNVQVDWEGSFKAIEQKEHDRFMDSDDESDVMDMKFLSSENFISEFEEIYGINNFEECFVSAKYIDDIENRMILVVRVDYIDKEFIVDVV